MDRYRDLIAEGRGASQREATLTVLFVSIEPTCCWYCRIETDRTKLATDETRRPRCTDLVKCRYTESARFLRVNHDDPRLIRAYERSADYSHRSLTARGVR